MVVVNYANESLASCYHLKIGFKPLRACELTVVPLTLDELDHAGLEAVAYSTPCDAECCSALARPRPRMINCNASSERLSADNRDVSKIKRNRGFDQIY